jgi:hypothetical protein
VERETHERHFCFVSSFESKKEDKKIVDPKKGETKVNIKNRKQRVNQKIEKKKRHKGKKVTILFFVGATDIQDYLIVVVALAWHLLVVGVK